MQLKLHSFIETSPQSFYFLVLKTINFLKQWSGKLTTCSIGNLNWNITLTLLLTMALCRLRPCSSIQSRMAWLNQSNPKVTVTLWIILANQSVGQTQEAESWPSFMQTIDQKFTALWVVLRWECHDKTLVHPCFLWSSRNITLSLIHTNMVDYHWALSLCCRISILS